MAFVAVAEFEFHINIWKESKKMIRKFDLLRLFLEENKYNEDLYMLPTMFEIPTFNVMSRHCI